MGFWNPVSGGLAAALLGAVMFVMAAPGTAAAQGAEAFETRVEAVEDLPEGPGREEAFYGCTACHAFVVVSRQSMSRDQWDGIIDEMVVKHSMAEPTPEERQVIVDYLAATYPPKARGGTWTNPFLK